MLNNQISNKTWLKNRKKIVLLPKVLQLQSYKKIASKYNKMEE